MQAGPLVKLSIGIQLIIWNWGLEVGNHRTVHEYVYRNQFVVYIENYALTYVLTSAMLDVTGHWWVVGLANYILFLKYHSGKVNVDADDPSCIPMGGYD